MQAERAIGSFIKKYFGLITINISEEITMRDFNRGGFGGPREMHKATCAECGNECEVPFKPTEGKPVYCKECYMKRKRY